MSAMIDLDHPVEHEPLYMFRDAGLVYFVNELVYEEFKESNGMRRNHLADVIISLATNKVIKSRHF